MNKILVCEWGYTMRLVDFYKVIKETEKTALVELVKSDEKEDGFLTGLAVPNLEKSISEKFEEKLRVYVKEDKKGNKFWISKKRGFKKYFYEWDGEPVRFNHCD